MGCAIRALPKGMIEEAGGALASVRASGDVACGSEVLTYE